MGYVAIKGGEDAIAHATELVEFYRLKERTPPVELVQICKPVQCSTVELGAVGQQVFAHRCPHHRPLDPGNGRIGVKRPIGGDRGGRGEIAGDAQLAH